MHNKLDRTIYLTPLSPHCYPKLTQKSFLNLNIWNSFLHSQLVDSQEHFEFMPTPVGDEATPLCAGTWLVLAHGAIVALPKE